MARLKPLPFVLSFSFHLQNVSQGALICRSIYGPTEGVP
jgi:hypothetical protein